MCQFLRATAYRAYAIPLLYGNIPSVRPSDEYKDRVRRFSTNTPLYLANGRPNRYTVEEEYKVACALLNGAAIDDLEQP